MTKTSIERLAEATGDTTDNVSAVLSNFHGQKIKKVLQAQIGLQIEDRRTMIEKCAPESLTEHQGVIKGLRLALGALEVGKDGK